MEILSFEFRRLRRVPVVNFGFSTRPVRDPRELRDEELLASGRVDLLAADYARTRRWPALNEKERYFLRERIRFAYEYASLASFSVKRPLLIAGRRHVWNEQRRILEWILIDVWRAAGAANWLEPFFVLAGDQHPSGRDWQFEVAE